MIGRLHDPGAASAAYRHCEAITRRQAANFYYGIRLLPPEKRRAMCAVYAFARRVDDIGDGELAREQKLRLLEREQLTLQALPGSAPGSAGAAPRPDPAHGDPVIAALAHASLRFALPRDALAELIEGVRMDVRGVSYERFDDLVVYCRHVAGAIGRLCLAIFGPAGADAEQHAKMRRLADDLGVALQITNILRDVREDAERGRVYLPREDLRRFGLISIDEQRPERALLAVFAGAGGGAGVTAAGNGAGAGEQDAAARLASLMRLEAQRARQWFDRGITLASMLDRRSAACVLAMAGIYHRLLERIAAHPERALGERMSLPVWEKAWVAASSMVFADPRARRRHQASGTPIGGRG
jgi:phytoene synthase